MLTSCSRIIRSISAVLTTSSSAIPVDNISDMDIVANMQTPLSPAVFHILMSLAEEERHGYAIIQDVEESSGGELRLSAGTLYRSIQRMLEQGLIVESKRRPAAAFD